MIDKIAPSVAAALAGTTRTCAPARAKASAAARPIPREAPVTRETGVAVMGLMRK